MIVEKNTTNPYGKQSLVGYLECTEETFIDLLQPLNVDFVHTFAIWIKSVSSGTMTVEGEPFQATTSWKKIEKTFTPTHTDFQLRFSFGKYYIYEAQLDLCDS